MSMCVCVCLSGVSLFQSLSLSPPHTHTSPLSTHDILLRILLCVVSTKPSSPTPRQHPQHHFTPHFTCRRHPPCPHHHRTPSSYPFLNPFPVYNTDVNQNAILVNVNGTSLQVLYISILFTYYKGRHCIIQHKNDDIQKRLSWLANQSLPPPLQGEDNVSLE